MTVPTPLLHKSVKSILSVLEAPEHKVSKGVSELLNIYYAAKAQNDKDPTKGRKKHPLIILEGLDGSGKSTVSSRFAKMINGKKWQTAPKSVSHLRFLFDENIALRHAFYSIGNYIAALEVQQILNNQPVVMDRYWHSTAAFAIAQAVQDEPSNYIMPPQGHPIYEWPADLYKPDIVLLLDVDENIRLERLSRRADFTAQEDLLRKSVEFRNNVILAYKHMVNPSVIFVDGNSTFEIELKDLYSRISHLLIEDKDEMHA